MMSGGVRVGGRAIAITPCEYVGRRWRECCGRGSGDNRSVELVMVGLVAGGRLNPARLDIGSRLVYIYSYRRITP